LPVKEKKCLRWALAYQEEKCLRWTFFFWTEAISPSPVENRKKNSWIRSCINSPYIERFQILHEVDIFKFKNLNGTLKDPPWNLFRKLFQAMSNNNCLHVYNNTFIFLRV
jgi:hypothetical protein